MVELQKELQTTEVTMAVQDVVDISRELSKHIEGLRAKELRHGSATKFASAMACGNSDEKELISLLSRLQSAKADLYAYILVANVGVTGSVRDGFVAVLPTILNTDRAVQQNLGQRLQIAEHSENRWSPQSGQFQPDTEWPCQIVS